MTVIAPANCQGVRNGERLHIDRDDIWPRDHLRELFISRQCYNSVVLSYVSLDTTGSRIRFLWSLFRLEIYSQTIEKQLHWMSIFKCFLNQFVFVWKSKEIYRSLRDDTKLFHNSCQAFSWHKQKLPVSILIFVKISSTNDLRKTKTLKNRITLLN